MIMSVERSPRMRITPPLVPKLAHTPVTVPSQGQSGSQMVGLAILRSQLLQQWVARPKYLSVKTVMLGQT